jgi:hypothetical protein
MTIGHSYKQRSTEIFQPAVPTQQGPHIQTITKNMEKTISNHAHSGATAGNGPPDPRPREVRDRIPAFQDYGLRMCGHHHHTPEGAHNNDLSDIQCRGCREFFPAPRLHFLPCHHALCCLCYNKAASAGSGMIDQQLSRTDHLDREVRQLQSIAAAVCDDDKLKDLEKEEGKKHYATEELAKLTCCKQTVELEPHMRCLEPAVATRLFIALRLRETPVEQRDLRCSWFDCGEFIPAECIFFVECHDCHHRLAVYCVRCARSTIRRGP